MPELPTEMVEDLQRLQGWVDALQVDYPTNLEQITDEIEALPDGDAEALLLITVIVLSEINP